MNQPLDTLKEDFDQTLKFIDKCDAHMFQVKNWAIVTCSAVIAFSISQNHDTLVFLNVVPLFAFLYLELIYKSLQDTAIKHTTDLSERIDKYLANSNTDDLLRDYKHSFGRTLQYPSFCRVFSVLGNRKRWHILNFYLWLALISVGAFMVAKFVA